eukprot:415211-Rhodomonas_salina.1
MRGRWDLEAETNEVRGRARADRHRDANRARDKESNRDAVREYQTLGTRFAGSIRWGSRGHGGTPQIKWVSGAVCMEVVACGTVCAAISRVCI